LKTKQKKRLKGTCAYSADILMVEINDEVQFVYVNVNVPVSCNSYFYSIL